MIPHRFFPGTVGQHGERKTAAKKEVCPAWANAILARGGIYMGET